MKGVVFSIDIQRTIIYDRGRGVRSIDGQKLCRFQRIDNIVHIVQEWTRPQGLDETGKPVMMLTVG